MIMQLQFKTFLLFIFILSSMLFTSKVIAQFEQNMQQHALALAVIQNQFIFKYSAIKSASIIYENNGHYNGLHLVLKKNAANEFTRLTHVGIGKPIILIFDNKVISISILQSELSGNLRITGLSKADALTFIQMLAQYQQAEKNQ